MPEFSMMLPKVFLKFGNMYSSSLGTSCLRKLSQRAPPPDASFVKQASIALSDEPEEKQNKQMLVFIGIIEKGENERDRSLYPDL